MRTLLIVLGVVLIAAAAAVRLVVAPNLAQRIPAGYGWEVNFIGTNTYPDPETGELNQDAVSTYTRSVEIVTDDPVVEALPGSVLLRDTYTTRDVNTGVVTWIYPFTAPVDPQTGLHMTEGWEDDIFLFPRDVQRTTYNFRAGSYEGLPVEFVREEQIEGVTTYLFGYEGYGEYTEAYTTSTGEFGGTVLEEGEEIRCGEDTLILQMWVEPVTGEVVKFEESCSDGDWVYNIESGEKVYPLGTWSGATTGDTVIRRLNDVNSQRNTLVLTSTILPVGMLTLGGVLLLIAYFVKPPKSSTPPSTSVMPKGKAAA
jgi:hypothetical protein